ncbi:hypothetical protein [Arsenophonus endosymbiont of Aphis craccivora]|uniref:hypothetical protein n=1 Tax=Arsenophonus endosymbiont of Aphis craccivora TaxID=1231049 RepID=UPI001EE163BA|nr:hypothetical protein [Arsenophonus endosymbiont of Aphis craccivora]
MLEKLKKYFHRLSGPNYVRLMDTPHAWGISFDEQIMPHSFKRPQEFATAIIEIIKKARYRCDISSLNSPDADWRKIILQAIDNGLSKK